MKKLKLILILTLLSGAALSCSDPSDEVAGDNPKEETDNGVIIEEPEDSVSHADSLLMTLLLDVSFNDDGTASDVSGHNIDITTMAGPGLCTYWSEAAGKNIARFFPSAGSRLSEGFYRINYGTEKILREGLQDGHSLEVQFMMSSEKTYTGEVKPFCGTEAGGMGFLLMSAGMSDGEIAYIPNTSTSGTSTWRWARSGIKAVPGVYYHVVGVWDKSAAKAHIYVNGELKGSVDAPGELVFPSSNSNRWFCIGGDSSTSGTAEAAWNGDIVIARVYDAPLDEESVKMLWKAADKPLQTETIVIKDIAMLPMATLAPGNSFRIVGDGFLQGDILRLVSVSDRSLTFDCRTTVNEGNAELIIPEGIGSGLYKVFAVRGNVSSPVGSVDLTITDTPESITKKPKVIAHRGFHKTVPENSIAALKAAQDLGCYGSEMDVWITTDGKIYVNHDGVISGKSIQNSTSEELSSVTLSNGEPLPTLESYLEQALKNTDTRLVIEVKQHSTADRNRHCTEEMLRIVREMGMEPYSDYISFGWDICTRIAELRPGATIGYLTTTSDFKSLADKGINCIDYAYNDLFRHPEYITSAHSLGMEVNIWTIDSTYDMARAIGYGVDYITTNNSDDLIGLVKKLFD